MDTLVVYTTSRKGRRLLSGVERTVEGEIHDGQFLATTYHVRVPFVGSLVYLEEVQNDFAIDVVGRRAVFEFGEKLHLFPRSIQLWQLL